MNAHLFVAGVFIARGKENALVTKNLVPGELVYGEKRISVEVSRTKKNVYTSLYSYNICYFAEKKLLYFRSQSTNHPGTGVW